LVAAYAGGNPDGDQDITVKGLSVARPNGGSHHQLALAPLKEHPYVGKATFVV
jgi:hypothetical protein